MAFLHAVNEFLLCIIISALICEIKSTDVTFRDLEELKITCYDVNSCKERANRGMKELNDGFACHCDSTCSQLDTCCLDSPFRDRNQARDVVNCRSVNGEFQQYYMIDKCPINGNANDAFQKQCEEEKYIEDDLMPRVPVTSLSSNLTYKNYFCFRCHEAGDAYLFWSLKLTSNIEFDRSLLEDVIPTYSRDNGTWLAPVGKDGELFPVTIRIVEPPKISDLPRTCFSNLISKCSEDWPEDEIRHQCGMYMSVIHIFGNSFQLYRNPHCALCNSEDLENYACWERGTSFAAGAPGKPFSFIHLLDINRSDGDKVGKIQRCDDSSAWDPFFKKCRRLTCALPGYAIKDGKCSAR